MARTRTPTFAKRRFLSLSLKNFPSPQVYDGDDDAKVVFEAPICGGETISICTFRFFHSQDLSLCSITVPASPFLSQQFEFQVSFQCISPDSFFTRGLPVYSFFALACLCKFSLISFSLVYFISFFYSLSCYGNAWKVGGPIDFELMEGIMQEILNEWSLYSCIYFDVVCNI